MSPVFLSAAGWVRPPFPHWHCRSQRHSKIHYWAHKVTCWFWKRTEGPHNTASRCRLHILSGFFIFNIFFSSIIQPASLIDMTAVRVISVPDIWSVLALGVGGGLERVLFFPLSWWPAFQISYCRPLYFITEGDLRQAFVACFSFFLGQKPTCSKVEIVCFDCPEKKKDLWLRKVLFKMSL